MEFLEFESFRIDLQRQRLLCCGLPVSISPKALQTLLLLVANGGQVVSKEEFFRKIWPNRFVEESNLAQNIFVLRKTLGEVRSEHQFIVTVPGEGYKFVAPVRKVGARQTTSREEGRQQDEDGGAGSLKSIRAATSIAVLPFKFVDAGKAAGHSKLGLADALITRLSLLKNIIVRPTSSITRYVDSPEDPSRIGRELGVNLLLGGVFQRVDDVVRVSAQLIRAQDGAVLWATNFDRQAANVLSLQNSIAEQVARALARRIAGESKQPRSKHATENIEAYQLYLMGLYFWDRRSKDDLFKSIEYFQRALALDRNYALAYAVMADAYALLAYSGYAASAAQAWEKSEAAAARALELDYTLAEAHTASALVKFNYEGATAPVEQSLKWAIALKPDYPTAHQRYGWHLMWKGQLPKAIAEMKRAQELDPLSVAINSALAALLIYARSYDEAIKYSQRAAELNPVYPDTRLNLADAYELKGLYGEALVQLERALELEHTHKFGLACMGHVYALSGQRAKAQGVLATLKAPPAGLKPQHYGIALIHAALDQQREAFVWLDRAIAHRSISSIQLRFDPKLDAIRDDPGYEDFLKRHDLTHLLT